MDLDSDLDNLNKLLLNRNGFKILKACEKNEPMKSEKKLQKAVEKMRKGKKK